MEFPLQEPTPWLKNDPQNKYLWIFKTFEKYWLIMHRVCMQIIGLISEGLGKRKDYFDPWFKKDCFSFLRAIHQLPNDLSKGDGELLFQKRHEDPKFITQEHSDYSFITLLSTFGYPGL